MFVRFKRLAGLGAAVAYLLSGGQATAQPWNIGLCGDWEVGAHALYFVPITCPYAYATAFTTAPGTVNSSGQAQVIPCRTEWGFRAFGNYLEKCFFAGVSYQWFQVTTTRSIIADNLIIHGSTQITGGRKATGQVGIEYQNADVRVGKYLRRTCGSTLYLYGNARWVDLSHRRAIDGFFSSLNAVINIQEKSQFEGGALGIGLGWEVNIWCDIGAFIDGNVLGVIGERSVRDVRFRRLIGTALTQVEESYPSEVCVIPEANCRVGLNYTYACGCWKLVGEVGYEVDYFWQASTLPDFVDANLAASQTAQFQPVCEDLGFSGLFFGGRLVF